MMKLTTLNGDPVALRREVVAAVQPRSDGGSNIALMPDGQRAINVTESYAKVTKQLAMGRA